MENILVVDVGTSSLKAMLYTRTGHLLHSASRPCELRVRAQAQLR